jgi:hypothetical protein
MNSNDEEQSKNKTDKGEFTKMHTLDLINTKLTKQKKHK